MELIEINVAVDDASKWLEHKVANYVRLHAVSGEICIFTPELIRDFRQYMLEGRKRLITGETKDEAINRYREMMKANEGKSFEERRDAINRFRAGM